MIWIEYLGIGDLFLLYDSRRGLMRGSGGNDARPWTRKRQQWSHSPKADLMMCTERWVTGRVGRIESGRNRYHGRPGTSFE